MSGIINKWHFFKIWKAFNFRTAWAVLWSKQAVALLILMQGGISNNG